MSKQQVLARRWRPQTFPEVIGQSAAVRALSNALESKRLHHAYLFVGTRGVGKTTLARLFAKALNCEQGVSASPCGQCNACQAIPQGHFTDLIEIDAASKTGVDDTREILENVQYRPTAGRFKVYLIDEVHMFSKSSFNALLKTLEEPPEHVKFLLATTDPQKLPITVLSRCMQLRLQRVDEDTLTQHFSRIAQAESIEVESEQALALIAQGADGSVRDGLSLMDQSIALGGGLITQDNVRTMMGMVADHHMQSLLTALIDRETEQALDSIERIAQSSSGFKGALTQLLEWAHQAILLKQLGPSSQWHARIRHINVEWVEGVRAEELHLIYDLLLKGQSDLHIAPNQRNAFEILMLRIIAFRPPLLDNSPKPVHQNQSIRAKVTTASSSSVKVQKQKIQSETPPQRSPNEQVVDASKLPKKQFESVPDLSASPIKEADPASASVQVQHASELNEHNWSQWLLQRRSEFSTIVWQYLRNSVWRQLLGNELTLGMMAAHAQMCKDVQKKQIADQLSGLMALPLTLNVETLETLKQSVHETQQQSALEVIDQDVSFQTIKQAFELSLDPDSVKHMDN